MDLRKGTLQGTRIYLQVKRPCPASRIAATAHRLETIRRECIDNLLVLCALNREAGWY